MTTLTLTDYSALSWDELKTRAKKADLKVAKRKRTEIVAELEAIDEMADNVIEIAGKASDSPPDPEQEKADLLNRLAELNKQPGVTPNYGPNYRAMTHGALKLECVARGHVDLTGTADGMIAALQAMDKQKGLEPCPAPTVVVQPDAVSISLPVQLKRTNSCAQPVKDVIFIVDSAGRKIAQVFRRGGVANGEPIIMDMEANAVKIQECFNG